MTIYLFCDAGMSTSLMVSKMQKAAEQEAEDFTIAAYSLSKIDEYANDADVILLGPQVRYKLASVKSAYPDKPVACIEMVDYGMLNGEKVLASAIEMSK